MNNAKITQSYHKTTEDLLHETIPQQNKKIEYITLEKKVNKRRADIYIKERTGKTIVIEIQNSPLKVDELIQRTYDYYKEGIYVLWILNGEGPCVASSKYPQHEKNVKISGLESYLHGMYGGRVYYINTDHNTNTFIIFALHFSPSDKKKYRKKQFRKKQFHGKYTTYYIKNAHFSYLPDWNFLCTEFSRFKIARFYEKNITSVLKKRIESCIVENKKNLDSHKKLKKIVLKQFKSKYGKYYVLNTLNCVMKEKINKKKNKK